MSLLVCQPSAYELHAQNTKVGEPGMARYAGECVRVHACVSECAHIPESGAGYPKTVEGCFQALCPQQLAGCRAGCLQHGLPKPQSQFLPPAAFLGSLQRFGARGIGPLGHLRSGLATH